MMIVLIEVGGELSVESLGALYDLFCVHDCWVLDEKQGLNERGHTVLGEQRMLGDILCGPDDERVTACRLSDWVSYCRLLHTRKEALRLAVDGEEFNDDEVGGVLQALGVDFRLNLPADDANQCCALVVRPGKKVMTYIYVEAYTGELLYTSDEIASMLDDKEKAYALMKSDSAPVKPLNLT